jgi:hypothetical protein
LLANSVSPKPAQKLVKEALGDAVALRHATSKEDFDEAAAKIRVRELARRITFDFKNRMMR